MPRQEIAKFVFSGGYASDVSVSVPTTYMQPGSRNAMATGAGLIVPFKGLTLVPGVKGSRVNFLTNDGFYGLGDHDTQGFGTIFKAIDLLFFMGGGPMFANGAEVMDGMAQVDASSQFQYLLKDSGEYDNGDSDHRFDVGHPKPSTPTIYNKNPPSSGQKPMNAVVAIAIWRADSHTGQPSRPSDSVVATITNGSAIVQFPAADANGQDVWGIGGTLLGVQVGNIYEIPTSINGEVLESTLAYSRTVVGKATIAIGTNLLELDGSTAVGDQFTSADIGRRVSIAGALDSWITEITDGFNAITKDDATANAAAANLTVTHAVDGYTRAVEVSWSDDDLLAVAQLAPNYAFEPMDGRFAGFLLDTFYIEDVEGTIFYSIPNEFSFPRRGRRIFTEDKAVVYLNTGRGYHWRIAKQSISRLYYSQGDTPIQLDIRSKNIGCKYPQNAALGYNGRLMVFSGRPCLVDTDGSFTSTIHSLVAAEFEGWEEQTADFPVVTDYDPIGQYDLWCKDNKIMAMHSPTGRWCSPIYIDEWCGAGAKIVGSVVVNEGLRLVVKVGTELRHYEWNVGDGSDLRVISYARQTPADTAVTEIQSVVRAGDDELGFTYKIIADFDRNVTAGTDTVPANTTPNQVATSFRPNVRGVNLLQLQVDVPGANGHAAIDYIDVFGEWNQSFSNPRA